MVVVCAAFSGSRAVADQIQATYRMGGAFIDLESDNPWCSTNLNHLTYLMSFTFVLPTSEDRFALDSQRSEWGTSVEASITANGVTVGYSGNCTIGLRTNYNPNPTTRDSVAWLILPGCFFVDLTNSYPFSGFADDSVDNLLNLGGYAYLGTKAAYNDMDKLSLVGVKSVPDSGITAVLFGVGLLSLVVLRGRWPK